MQKLPLYLLLLWPFSLAFAQSNTTLNVEIDTSVHHQEMVGFGAALTWYCDRVISSPNKDAITQLIFEDLGADIIRFKNWYYPDNYPINKTTDQFEVSWFKSHYDATIELHELAKSYNPNVKTLVSSWGPPSGLKSNGALETGTLAKDGDGNFRYADFGVYWNDVLDHIGISPDYISIQNEPGYENTGWTTCAWRPQESTSYPSYEKGLEAVYDHIKDRENLPRILGPEMENIGSAPWGGNTFSTVTATVRDKEYLAGYAYHLYNYYGSPENINVSNLNMIRDDFGDKPSFMTEFSSGDYDWLQMAHMVQLNLLEANVSAYIYWPMVWDSSASDEIIGITSNGAYAVTPYYYALKHFAKHIDAGYKRVEATTGSGPLRISAFAHPTEAGLTLIVTNKGTEQKLSLKNADLNISSVAISQSTEGNYFEDLGSQGQFEVITIPASSITTMALTLDASPKTVLGTKKTLSNTGIIYPNPAKNQVFILNGNSQTRWSIFAMDGRLLLKGSGAEADIHSLQKGLYLLKSDLGSGRFVKN